MGQVLWQNNFRKWSAPFPFLLKKTIKQEVHHRHIMKAISNLGLLAAVVKNQIVEHLDSTHHPLLFFPEGWDNSGSFLRTQLFLFRLMIT